MNSVVTFTDGSKWAVVAEANYDGDVYNYLVGVNEAEDDFLDKYKVVKIVLENSKKYMDDVKDKDILKKVSPLLMPEVKKYIDNPELLADLK